jgi:hypothetical protein
LFVNPGGLVSGAMIGLFVVMNLAWLVGLAQTALSRTPHMAGGS